MRQLIEKKDMQPLTSVRLDDECGVSVKLDTILAQDHPATHSHANDGTATDKTLKSISSLVKLLPTTTVLAFQTLNPSFTNHGRCLEANKILTLSFIVVCAITCAFFSITDSVMYKGKLYYGLATFNGLYIFNFDDEDTQHVRDWFKEHCNKRYKLRISDGVHVVFTVIVFLAVSFGDGYVQTCFFSGADDNERQWLTNLPLGVSFLASIVFLLMPGTRKGIGYSTDTETPELPAPDSSSSELEPLKNNERDRSGSDFVVEVPTIAS